MRVKDLEELFDYSYWANDRLFEVAAQLTPEEFTKPVAGSYGSVRNTLVHVLSAEWGWLDRCGGARRGNALIPTDYPTLISLLHQWHQIESHTREFFGTLKDEDLDRVVEFTLGDGPSRAVPLGTPTSPRSPPRRSSSGAGRASAQVPGIRSRQLRYLDLLHSTLKTWIENPQKRVARSL